jgi:hypothetical protein
MLWILPYKHELVQPIVPVLDRYAASPFRSARRIRVSPATGSCVIAGRNGQGQSYVRHLSAVALAAYLAQLVHNVW